MHEFIDDNPEELSDFDFDSTIWLSQRATYLPRDGGAYEFTFWWQLTDETPLPPSDGAMTFLGPDCDVLYQETVRVHTCDGGVACDNDTANNGKLYLTDSPTGHKLTVVRAVFSR